VNVVAIVVVRLTLEESFGNSKNKIKHFKFALKKEST
jgi:hypothetical protein